MIRSGTVADSTRLLSPSPDVVDVVPAAQTVLVQARPGRGVDRLGIHRVLRAAGGVVDTEAVDSAKYEAFMGATMDCVTADAG